MPRFSSEPPRPSAARAVRRTAGTLALLALLLFPAAAPASPQALIRDCLTNGRVAGHYSQQDYTQALANLPTDVAEYSDCAGVIRHAQLTAAGGAGGSSTGSGTASPGGGPAAAPGAGAAAVNPRQDPLSLATPAERAAVAQARQGGGAALDVGGRLLRPGVVATRTSSILNTLPTPLLIALGALILIAMAVCGRHARNLVRARRTD
ncbi:MAG: hypothetical protein QOF77_2193 [Solirubrobacteraceae bacterium]|jgi:hypothetical protein|nr:hypothetical protein [Solirubrobacteraceae bacterium]